MGEFSHSVTGRKRTVNLYWKKAIFSRDKWWWDSEPERDITIRWPKHRKLVWQHGRW